MVTSAADKTMKSWDLRMLSGPITEYHLYAHANNLAFSEKGLVAMSMGNIVEVSLVLNCISFTLHVSISVSYIY